MELWEWAKGRVIGAISFSPCTAGFTDTILLFIIHTIVFGVEKAEG